MGQVKQGAEIYQALGAADAAMFSIILMLGFLLVCYFWRIKPMQEARETRQWQFVQDSMQRQEKLMTENNLLLKGFVEVSTSQLKTIAAHDERSASIARDVDHINEFIKTLASQSSVDRLGERVTMLQLRMGGD